MSDDKLLEQIRSGSFGFADDYGSPKEEIFGDDFAQSAFIGEDVSGLQFLTFYVGSQTYGVPLEIIHTVLNTGVISNYPSANEFLLGGFQFRNEVMPLVDMAACLNEEENEPLQKILVIEQVNRRVGFCVRSIRRAQHIAYLDLAPVADDLKLSTGHLFDAVANVENETILILSPQALFARLGAKNDGE